MRQLILPLPPCLHPGSLTDCVHQCEHEVKRFKRRNKRFTPKQFISWCLNTHLVQVTGLTQVEINLNPGLTLWWTEYCGGHSKSHFGTSTSFLTPKFQFTQELKKLSSMHNHHKALETEESIFDMLILFLARTILHKGNTNHLYPKLPPTLYIKT